MITSQFLGPVLFSDGKVGAAFDFRGANFVEIPSIPLNSFTLELWLNQRTRSAEPDIGSILVSAEVCGVVDDWGVSLLPDGRLRVQVGDVTQPGTSYSSFPTSASSIPLNAFTHVAVTRNTNNSEIKIYINGVLDSTHVSPHNRVLGAMNPTCDTDLHQNRIGFGNLRRQAVLGGDAQAFDGLIDEVSLYSRPLSGEEIAAIYRSGNAGKCLPAPPPCVHVPSDVVSWWPAEGNANDIVNTHNGTLINGTAFTNGIVGQAFSFDGADDFVSFGNSVGNFGTNDFTVEFWLRTRSTRLESVVEKWPVCTWASLWYIRLGGPGVLAGTVNAEIHQDASGTNGMVLTTTTSVNDGLFHHVALVRRGTTGAFYIDGSLNATALAPGILNVSNSVDMVAGRSVCVGVDGTSPFTGQLDELAVYNRALSASEIQEIYSGGGVGKCPPVSEPHCVQPPPGLVGWWKGDGGTTDTLGKNNGALVGNASFAPGVVGQGFSFDGDNDSVMIGNPAALQLQDFTVEAWVKRANTSKASLDVVTVGHIFGYGYGGYVFALLDDGRLTLGQVGISGVNSTMSIRDTNWHHVAVSKASGSVAFYVDGVGEAAPQYNPSFYFISSAQIGASQWDGTRPTGSFLGSIDEVSIYGRGLSSSEMQALFNAGSAGKCPPSAPPVTAFANGSFESPTLAPGASVDLPAGSTTLIGWVVDNTGLVSWRNGPAYGVAPVDGAQEIGFNGADTPVGGSISQTFSTIPGQTYQVRFNVGRQGPGSGTMSLRADVTSADGTVLGSLNAFAPDSPGYGLARTFTFTATTSTSTLTFRDTSSATVAVDPLLDNVSVVPVQSCVPPPSDLVSWWKGDGNANDVTGAYNSTFMNGITFTDGRVGQAFDFNGIDSQVTFGNTIGNFDTNDFTVEFWIRTTATRHESVIEKWPTCGYSSMWGIRIGSAVPWSGPGRLEAEMYSDAAGTDQNAISAGRPINDGLFHHVALVRTRTNLVFYIDGVPDVATNVLSGSISRIDNTANLTVGRSVCVGVDGTSPFTGQLDEIAVYNRALSASEIQAIYNAGGAGKCALPLLPARALAHWRFDEPDGSIAHDSAGSFNGTLSSSGAAFVSGGISGGALSLSKTNNGLVNMGNVLGLDHTDFSIVAWIKMTPQDKTECSLFISKQEAGWANGYVLEANACVAFAQVGKVWFSDSALPGQEITSTASVNDGSWHQVVAVYETAGNKSIYIDGAPAEASKASMAIVPNTGVFLIGGGDFNGIPLGQFTGLVDDVQVYNYALSSSEVDFLFQNPSQEISAHDLPPGQWRLTTVAGVGGTITRDPDLAKYTNGAVVMVTAVPDAGFTFSGWSSDASGTSNATTITITMNGDKSVTADFREIPARVLAVVSPEARQEGSTIDVPITLTSQGEVGGMSFVVHFNPTYLRDPDLEWSSVVGSALNQVGYETPGRVRATFALPATAVPAGTQTIANITFRTRSVPSTLSTDLRLEIIDASKPTGDPITSGSYAQSGSAQILVRRVIGDNNANNRLDIGDASIIQRLLTGIDPVRSWDVTGNDVNANTRLDSGDVIRVLRVVVGLDPEPQLQSGASTGSGRLAKSGLQKSGPAPGQVTLSLDKLSAQPGDLVTLQVRLKGLATSLEGAAATLDYPTNALRLLNSQSQRTGPIVPASALTVWNVAPAQTDYASQSGRVLLAMSSPATWPTNEGVLAEFVFQVQPGQTAQYRWPIRVSNVEVTASGYDVQSLADTETFYIGRVPIPPNLNSTSVGLSSNGFSLSLTGESGVPYRIEASSDLATWSPLVTLMTGSNGALSFVDSAATNSPQRFYRAKQQ